MPLEQIDKQLSPSIYYTINILKDFFEKNNIGFNIDWNNIYIKDLENYKNIEDNVYSLIWKLDLEYKAISNISFLSNKYIVLEFSKQGDSDEYLKIIYSEDLATYTKEIIEHYKNKLIKSWK